MKSYVIPTMAIKTRQTICQLNGGGGGSSRWCQICASVATFVAVASKMFIFRIYIE